MSNFTLTQFDGQRIVECVQACEGLKVQYFRDLFKILDDTVDVLGCADSTLTAETRKRLLNNLKGTLEFMRGER